jgi:2-oxoglutarate dehydrogenase E2 component (dihydrolipoamide succinyltransferase)
MTRQRIECRLPNLDLGDIAICACAWHADIGQRVVEGDRLLEILAGDVLVDLPAPASGILVERCAGSDDILAVGQLLAVVEAS